MRYAYMALKHNAKRRQKEFDLTYEQFIEFCIETDYLVGKGKTKHSYSIDRIDNSKGYTLSNIRILTLSANSQKSDFQLTAEGANQLTAEGAHPLSAKGANQLTAEGAHPLSAEGANQLTTEGAHPLSAEGANQLTAKNPKLVKKLEYDYRTKQAWVWTIPTIENKEDLPF